MRSTRLISTTTMVLLLGPGPGSGQARLSPLAKHYLPLADEETSAVAAGDLDGDNDLDLVVTNRSSIARQHGDRVLLNDGAAGFRAVPIAVDPSNYGTSVALADLDGDGDLDIFLGRQDRVSFGYLAQNRLFLGDGRGTFTT